MGGEETVINFQLAKDLKVPNLYNNSSITLEKARAMKLDHNVDFYEVKPKT